jgi:NAD(P)-dependent dehydrogenase (short-subunit alcohol dehydrogenase family)
MQLEGKRVAVVGGANGIGAAVVRAFVREGASVAALDIRDSDGESVVSAANEKGGPGNAHYFHCDASERAEVKEAFSAAAGVLGGFDALVATVGIHNEAPAESIDDDQFDRMMNINVRSIFVTNQEIFPYLVENGGGRIINFGSGAGLRPTPTAAHYSASKGAVISWTRSLAFAWGEHNITANVVNPAIARTLMFGNALDKAVSAGEQSTADRLASMFPLGSRRFPPTDEDLPVGFGDPDSDLAPVLVFLVGDGARFMTGQIFAVDGGLTPSR